MEIGFFNETQLETKEYEETIKNVLETLADGIMNVIFVTKEEIQNINKEYRNIDKVTDVISFANKDNDDLIEKLAIDESNNELGDIFICLEKAFEQAELYGHSQKREVGFLAVHGYLHLLGYDHMTKEDENTMFAKQDEILKKANLER